MSKGADDETEMEDGMTTSERRRRRRRGAGLRIPSDNVPRRTGPVVAPVPEDPAVAMSIAYAFAGSGSPVDEGSAPTRLPTGELETDLNEGLGDMEDATAFSPPPSIAGAATADGSVPGMTAEDVVPDGRTRQMAAISLEALGLSDVEEALGNGHGVNITGEVDIDVDSLDDASDDAAPDREDETGDDFGENEAPISRVSARPTTIPPPLPVSVPSRQMESVTSERHRADTDVSTNEPPRAGKDDVPPAAPALAAASAPVPRLSRAATVALSEDDLEELLEMTPPPRPVPLAPDALTRGVAPAATAPAVASLGAVTHSAVPESVSSAPSSPVAASSAAPRAAVHGNSTGEAVALAEEDLQEVASPFGPADASDSGEILADEIVEVEQESRAPVVSAPPAPPPAAPQQHAKPPAAPKKPLAARHAQAASLGAASPSNDPESRKKRRGKPWFEEVFDEDYLRTLPFLTPQATQAEALMVIESLGVAAGASVLDVGCGYGRHAMELAARGFHVVGVDLSLPLLLRGADEAQRRGLDINFVHADMREMDFDAQFDGAYCLFSTFGFFDDETNKKTASLIAKALKPGAKFMLEILNRDYVTADLPARVWWEGDGCVVLEEVEFNYFSSRVQSKRSVVFDDGRQVEQEISVRVYSLHEVGKLLHAAGLRVLEVSGSMASRGRFLGTRSREIIVVAERRPPDGKS